MKYNEIKESDLPIIARLNTKNPWGKSIKVNNILVTTTSNTKINSKTDFDKLLPIAKYVILEKELEEKKEVSSNNDSNETVNTAEKKVATNKKTSTTTKKKKSS